MKVIVITDEKIIKPAVKGFKVHNFLWQEFGNKDLNLRDYDGVIIDLTGVESKAGEINWTSFTKALNFEVSKDILLESSSFVIVIGNPFIKSGSKTIAELLGIQMTHVEGKGDSIHKTKYYEKSKYKDYLQNIKAYKYSFDNPIVIPKIQGLAERINFEHAVDEVPFLVTRAGKIVASILNPVVYDKNYAGYRNTVHDIYNGELIFLPSTALDTSEAIRILLEANKEQGGDNSKPGWLDSLKVSGEDEVTKKIFDKQVIIDETSAQKNILLSELAALRKPLEILYKSDKPLEESIKDLLKNIGAIVVEPKTGEKVEFYIEFEDKKFVVEVKSTIGKTIDQKGLRQVLDWKNDAFDETGEDYKPIVFASVEYDKPLDQRNADILPANLIIYADKKAIGVMTVEALYQVSQDIVAGKTTINAFIDQIYNLSALYEYKKEAQPDIEINL